MAGLGEGVGAGACRWLEAFAAAVAIGDAAASAASVAGLAVGAVTGAAAGAANEFGAVPATAPASPVGLGRARISRLPSELRMT